MVKCFLSPHSYNLEFYECLRHNQSLLPGFCPLIKSYGSSLLVFQIHAPTLGVVHSRTQPSRHQARELFYIGLMPFADAGPDNSLRRRGAPPWLLTLILKRKVNIVPYNSFSTYDCFVVSLISHNYRVVT